MSDTADRPRPGDASEILFLSAPSRDALIRRVRALIGADPGTAALSLAAEPHRDAHRLVILAETPAELSERAERAITALGAATKPRLNLSNVIFYGDLNAEPAQAGRVAVLFPGFGARDLRLLDALSARPSIAASLERLTGRVRRRKDDETTPVWRQLDAILTADLAAWALIGNLQITPDAVVGHSFGEYAALVASGRAESMSAIAPVLAQIARESRRRGLADSSLGMIAVTAASRALVDAHIAAAPSDLAIALDNCPQQIVVWGTTRALADLETKVRARGEVVFPIADLSLPVHTPFFPVDFPTLVDAFSRLSLGGTDRSTSPEVWSAGTAAPMPERPDDARALLAAGWRAPVRFRETILAMHDAGIRTFIEAGPGGRLCGFARDTLRGRSFAIAPLNVEGQPVWRQVGLTLGTLFTRGIPFDPAALYADGPLRHRDLPDGTPSSAATRRPATASVLSSDALSRVMTEVAALLAIDDADAIDPDAGLFDLGLTSIMAVELAARLETAFGRSLPDTLAFDYPTCRSLARHLSGDDANRVTAASAQADTAAHRPADEHAPIAIVGMSCRMPGGVSSPDEFWALLANGVDAVGMVPADRWDPAAFDHYLEESDRPRARHGAFLSDIRGFEPALFGISPREAISLDPQQRLLLELAWEALEDAGIDATSLADSHTGVFVGMSSADYAQRMTPRERMAARGYLGTGNAASTAAGRLSFVLGLHGPAMTIDTACSSSLVALHLACQSLRRGESEAAIAAGVNLLISPETTMFLANAQALSPTGRCRTFDASADGYVRAEGGGVVVLKRLADAERDGDRILAVVRGSAVNHSGHTSGLTVPSGPAERAVVSRALADASLTPDAVGFLEAHGTGTALGDPIEIQALAGAFGNRARRIPIASVKTNVGHLEAAAGMAGLIKTVLQLQHRQIAPSLHFGTPNPRVAWTQVPFDVVTALQPWPADGPRVAGVSSFGISGTNAHAVVQEYPAPAVRRDDDQPQVLTLSANSPEAVRSMAGRLAARLSAPNAPSVADAAWTLATGRRAFPYRRSFAVRDREEAQRALIAFAGDVTSLQKVDRRAPQIAFLFTGQGAQTVNMGRGLEYDPTYAAALERVLALFAALAPAGAPALRDVMHGTPPEALHHTGWAQPALFAVEYALSEWWAARGVRPDAVIGHSVGEYTAAVVAGVLSLEDGARLLWRRAELMQRLSPGGAMLAVTARAEDAERLVHDIGDGLAVAAINGSEQVVLSGPETAVARARAIATARHWRHAPLVVSHAFHSAAMDPILDDVTTAGTGIRFHEPRIPIVSNLTGAFATPQGRELQSADYWARHLRAPVQFAAGMRALVDRGIRVCVEIGPRPVLIGLGRATIERTDMHWVPSLAPGEDDTMQVARATAALTDAGVAINWGRVTSLRGARRAALPTYPFERTPYWLPSALTRARTGDASRQSGRWLGDRAPQPGDGTLVRFETELITTALEDIAESRVQGQAILPVSAFLTIAARLAAALGLDETSAIADMTLAAPLVVPRTGVRVQTIATPQRDGRWQAGIYSLDTDRSQWQEHARFVLAHLTTSPASQALPRPNQSSDTTVDGPEFYRRSLRFGAEYGAPAQVLTALRFGPSGADADAVCDANDDRVPLVLIDGAFQTLGAALLAATGRVVTATRSVAAVRTLRVRSTPTIRARIVVTPSDPTWTSTSITIVDSATSDMIATLDGIVSETAPLPAPSADATSIGSHEHTDITDPAHATRFLQRAVAAILRLPAGSAPDTAAAFSQMGFDSLMAMHLSALVEQRLGVVIPVAEIIERGSIGALSERLANRPAGTDAPPTAPRFVEGDL